MSIFGPAYQPCLERVLGLECWILKLTWQFEGPLASLKCLKILKHPSNPLSFNGLIHSWHNLQSMSYSWIGFFGQDKFKKVLSSLHQWKLIGRTYLETWGYSALLLSQVDPRTHWCSLYCKARPLPSANPFTQPMRALSKILQWGNTCLNAAEAYQNRRSSS